MKARGSEAWLGRRLIIAIYKSGNRTIFIRSILKYIIDLFEGNFMAFTMELNS